MHQNSKCNRQILCSVAILKACCLYAKITEEITKEIGYQFSYSYTCSNMPYK